MIKILLIILGVMLIFDILVFQWSPIVITGKYEGQILDSNSGAPIPNVYISARWTTFTPKIVDADYGELGNYTTLSDTNGMFTIPSKVFTSFPPFFVIGGEVYSQLLVHFVKPEYMQASIYPDRKAIGHESCKAEKQGHKLIVKLFRAEEDYKNAPWNISQSGVSNNWDPVLNTYRNYCAGILRANNATNIIGVFYPLQEIVNNYPDNEKMWELFKKEIKDSKLEKDWNKESFLRFFYKEAIRNRISETMEESKKMAASRFQ